MRKPLNVIVSVSALLVFGLIAVLASVGCNPATPSDPSSIYISNTNTNIQNGAPSPAPGVNGALPAGSTVRIEIFGASCPNGANPRPNPGELKVGCSLAVTATPKGPDGQNLTPDVHGPNCAWAVAVGSNVLRVVEDGAQPFNATVLATATGTGAITAVVKGTTGTMPITVVP